MADEIDQTRSHQNNADHGRAVFLSVLKSMPITVQLQTVRQLLSDLIERAGRGSYLGRIYMKAHDALDTTKE